MMVPSPGMGAPVAGAAGTSMVSPAGGSTAGRAGGIECCVAFRCGFERGGAGASECGHQWRNEFARTNRVCRAIRCEGVGAQATS
jgi:hypothetical protein